jgi:hypothetical protein
MKKTVAIIGASADRSKYGNKAVRAYQSQGWDVYPINLHEDEIEGLRVYRSVRDVPVALNEVSVYLPPSRVIEVLPEIAEKGCEELWLNPGAESDEAVKEAERLGLNVIQACSIIGVGTTPENFR